MMQIKSNAIGVDRTRNRIFDKNNLTFSINSIPLHYFLSYPEGYQPALQIAILKSCEF